MSPDTGPVNGQPGSQKPASDTARPLEVVKVKIFDRTCSFKSNRPELVREIASKTEEELSLVRGQLPGLTNDIDLAAHVAFRLARELTRCFQKIAELNSTLDESRERVERMTMIIDQNLGE
jgi:hypothetical protein